MGTAGPSLESCEHDVAEWAVAEEVRLKTYRPNDKLRYLRALYKILQGIYHHLEIWPSSGPLSPPVALGEIKALPASHSSQRTGSEASSVLDIQGGRVTLAAHVVRHTEHEYQLQRLQ
ncbi:hypothetical protein NDU88_009647 [Pleurodeles waltl]|uniref:Uncharacterized protein n=1 Tax=Pleurodeles waltl TaxID=8319 RepID=A0AAV7QY48_PLEWA|nr:hypothetical protein NDU88_009647 [Pleurodeles waltl]